MLLVDLRHIGKAYKVGDTNIEALRDISFSIGRGEYVAIMGPSGSGKSTILHILGILDTATSGTYLFEKYDITTLSDREQARIRNRHFGFIFQRFNLFSELSAMENVMLPMGYAGLSKPQRKERAGELLVEVGLENRMNHRPTMLSGGEQQRVAIARALSNGPDVILADEPTGNLSTDAGEEIIQLLETFHRRGVTIVMVTHNPSQAARTERIIQIKDGRLHSDTRQGGSR
ncbi:ABC transporter ATP-binding protein [Sediminispirochaeta smaragdinae]